MKLTYISEFDRGDGLVKITSDDFTHFFHRFKHKRLFVVKFSHETHGTTSHFTLSKTFQNQYEQVDESNELSNHLNEISEKKKCLLI